MPAATARPSSAPPGPAASSAPAGPTIVSPRPEPPLGVNRDSEALDRLPAGLADVVVAIGGNIGPVKETLRWAVQRLRTMPGLEVTGVAPLARSAAVGKPAQPDYLNTVVVGRTLLPPRELLHRLNALEKEAGRVRTEVNGPRTLDLDIIVYGSLTVSADDLTIPHPRAHERAFVLQPWAALQPDATLPGPSGGAVTTLAAAAPDLTGIRWMALDWLTDPEPDKDPETR
jgi:dihydroneopterin aldolase / 2-amino-4-hydroxy-6-hydroxymethyldihydropteridine diphosphokinase